MHELLPIVAGVVTGLLVERLRSANLRVMVVVVLSLIYGVAASYISGELLISWSFILVDMAFVMLAALATLAVMKWWARGLSPRP